MPCNTYGPNDNYDLLTSHFYPALIKKIYLAKKNNKKQITLWGNGKAKREIMYVDDLADACIFFLDKKTNETLINIGSGEEKTILQFANFLIKKMNLKLKIKFDKKKPNGTPRKILNSSIANKYGWIPKVNLDKGFKYVYNSFINSKNK